MSSATETLHHKAYASANFPLDPEGRTYHVGTKRGEVANRILVVGDLQRADLYAKLYFDKNSPTHRVLSSRGFLTLTGTVQGVPISVIGTGMGISMIDFTIREVRAIVDGDIAMIRVGTCGTYDSQVQPGNVVVNNGAILVRRNPDYFRAKLKNQTTTEKPYILSQIVESDVKLTQALEQSMKEVVGEQNVKVGLDATAESFYSSQGRTTSLFTDENENLLQEIKQTYPQFTTLEMETFQLFDLAECCTQRFIAGCALIVLAQRQTDVFIDPELKGQREAQAGKGAILALLKAEIHSEMKTQECVWLQQKN